MSVHEYTRREERTKRIERVATLVATLVNLGAGWTEAIEEVALELGVSARAVAACVAETSSRLNDPYLESIGV